MKVRRTATIKKKTGIEILHADCKKEKKVKEMSRRTRERTNAKKKRSNKEGKWQKGWLQSVGLEPTPPEGPVP